MPDSQIHVVPDLKAVAADAAERIVRLAQDAIAQRKTFSIALSGGNTPKVLYELLATAPYSTRIEWKKWEIYFGDERCVPPDHPESNYGMAAKSLLNRVPIPPTQIYRMKGELDPQTAAIEYGRTMKEKFGDGGMDLVLLGMGDDGHTASLFPQTEALKETHHRCVANFVPKLNVWRITLSAPFINRARNVIVLLSGESKAKRVEEVLQGPKNPAHLPIQMIEPTSGNLLWLLDAAAAGMSA